jgi:hypothetical protein
MILDNEHIAQDVLEAYALGHLSEADEESVEEHLLICHECQDRLGEIDDFIRAIRVASPAVAASQGKPKKSVWESIGEFAGNWAGWKPVCAAGALAAVLAIIVLAPNQQGAGGQEVAVQLETMRGDGNATTEGVAGRPLRLEIDITGLDGMSRLAVEVADASGTPIWRAAAEPASARSLSVRVDAALRSGQYWVRLYNAQAPGELLREYALKIRAAE